MNNPGMTNLDISPALASILSMGGGSAPSSAPSGGNARAGLASGMTSVSQDAVRLCQENGIAVIPGSCPNQFLAPDFGHKMMRVLWGALGFMKVSRSAQG